MSDFDHQKDYVLENSHVLLRPLANSDAELLAPFVRNEADIWKYSLLPMDDEEDLNYYITSALRDRDDEEAYPFVVVDKKTGEVAGCTRLYRINPSYQSLLIGYTWYGKKFQGTGINKHCKFLLLQFVFDALDFLRVEFNADAKNERSIAALKSIGCQVEGILRSNMPALQGGRRDSIVLSILKPEWEGGLKNQLEQKINSLNLVGSAL